MKKNIASFLTVILGIFILYILKTGYCKFSESCGNTNYVEHIKSVIEPLKEKIDDFYVINKRYPEWDEMARLLESSGCQKLTLISKEPIIISPLTGKPMIDINGKSFFSYDYDCEIKGFSLKMRASEFKVGTSEFTDATRRQLNRKILGALTLFYKIGNLSSCSLDFEKGETKMECGRSSWINWNA